MAASFSAADRAKHGVVNTVAGSSIPKQVVVLIGMPSCDVGVRPDSAMAWRPTARMIPKLFWVCSTQRLEERPNQCPPGRQRPTAR